MSATLTRPVPFPAAASAASSALSQAVLGFYLASLALLPWMWFPPFPWLHEHAQWSDAVLALTAALWTLEHWYTRAWPRWRPVHSALVIYFAATALSLLFTPPYSLARAGKLIGVAELMVLAYITSDIAARAGRAISLTIALTSLAVATAAVAAFMLLFCAGEFTNFVGIYGELKPSAWCGRIQAGTYNPNLLASYCIFAAAVIAQAGTRLPRSLRRAAQVGLLITVVLTFSRGILGFVLAAVIRGANTRRRRIGAAICAPTCIGIMVSLSIWSLTLDPTRPLGAHFDTGRAPTRREAALTALGTIRSNPIFGSGLDSSPGWSRGIPFDAHMTIISVGATLGMPALVAFVSLFAMLWRGRARPTNLALWGGIAGLALDALAQDIQNFRHLWVIVGLADSSAGAGVNWILPEGGSTGENR